MAPTQVLMQDPCLLGLSEALTGAHKDRVGLGHGPRDHVNGRILEPLRPEARM